MKQKFHVSWWLEPFSIRHAMGTKVQSGLSTWKTLYKITAI